VSDPPRDPPRVRDPWLRGWPWLHLVVCAVVLLSLYRGALAGPFISDDTDLIVDNPVVEGLSPAHLRAIFEPRGTQTVLTGTWAPLHMLAIATERVLFGLEPPAWHVVNVLLHALATVLVASLFLASGLAPPTALLGAALFGLHPALVEGVAWISQSKTVICGVFAFGALRAWRTRPALATALFAAALLSKPHAIFLLPTAAAFAFVWRDGRARVAWLVGWCALLALYALPEMLAFLDYSGYQPQDSPDLLLRVRSVGAIAARYAWMASTSLNVAAFAQPDPPRSWLDPWWLAGVPLLIALAWRMLVALRARREEGAYWVFAATAFAPVSQAFPFLFPIADRYLYFALPGLLGAALLALAPLARGSAAAPRFRLAGALAGVALAAFFAVRTDARARLWREPTLLFLDSAAHYPDGYPAQMMRARRAAQLGDAVAAAEALRAAAARGLGDFMSVVDDPALAPIATSPEFAAVVREMADRFVATNPVRADTDQATLHLLAHAQLIRDDRRAAAEAFAAAIHAGGLQDEVLREELAALLAAEPSLRDVTN